MKPRRTIRMIRATEYDKGWKIMYRARVWLADKLMVMADELRDRPGTVAAWYQIADTSDNESYTNEFRDECFRCLKDSVMQRYMDRPVTREQVIEAFDFVREHDSEYAGSYDDLMLDELDRRQRARGCLLGKGKQHGTQNRVADQD
jgi:hypothetical protein